MHLYRRRCAKSNKSGGQKDRVDAIAKGWNSAKATTNSPTNPSNPNPTTPVSPTNPNTGNPNPNNPDNTNPANDPSWIGLTIQSNKTETVLLSDDGKNFQQAAIKAGESYIFKFEIYNYGWLRLKHFNGYRTFKLLHGKDYRILWNRRTSNWTVTEVPD